jgi:hypothetical protein
MTLIELIKDNLLLSSIIYSITSEKVGYLLWTCNFDSFSVSVSRSKRISIKWLFHSV